MENNKSMWVLGHKVKPQKISGDYDMVYGETPAKVPGPPPHYHSGYHEVFLVVEGEMEFMINGEVMTVGAGESVDLSPNVLHTFQNKSDLPCKWVNVHSPKGFLAFFEDVGIPEKEENSMKKSIDQSVIEQIMKTASSYDMHIKLQ